MRAERSELRRSLEGDAVGELELRQLGSVTRNPAAAHKTFDARASCSIPPIARVAIDS